MTVTRCWRIPSRNTYSAFTTDFSLSLWTRKAKSELGRLQLELSTRQAIHCWSQTLSQWQWFLIDLPQQFCLLFTINLIPWCEEFMLKMCKSWFHRLISFDCFSGDLSQICWQKSRRRCSSEKPQKSNGRKSGWTACLFAIESSQPLDQFPRKPKKLFVLLHSNPTKGTGNHGLIVRACVSYDEIFDDHGSSSRIMIINLEQSQQEFKYHRENQVWGRQLSILNEMFVFVFGKATVCLAVVCHSHPGGSCQCLVGCRRRRSHWETRCHGLLYHWWQDAIRPILRRFMQERACVCPNPGWRFHKDTIRQYAPIVESYFFEILCLGSWNMKNEH